LVVDRCALVIEAKGHTFSDRAWLGDKPRLCTKLDETIGKGTRQIGRLVRTLDVDGHVTLHHGTGTVVLDKRSIDRVFGLVVTLDDLGSLAVDLDALTALGVRVDHAAKALAISVSNLDQMVRVVP
jgi:hypothetical protein